jgi:hypothetical protein
MSAVTLVQPDNELDFESLVDRLENLADSINSSHWWVKRFGVFMLANAIVAGRQLSEAKELVRAELGHGHWLPWVKQNCHFSPRTAQKYMRASRQFQDLDPLSLKDEQLQEALKDLTLEQLLDALAEPKPGDPVVPEEEPPNATAPSHLPEAPAPVEAPAPEEFQLQLVEPPPPAAHTELIQDQALLMVAATIRGYSVQDAIVKRDELIALRSAIDAALEKAEA